MSGAVFAAAIILLIASDSPEDRFSEGRSAVWTDQILQAPSQAAGQGASWREMELSEGQIDLQHLYSPYAVLTDVASGQVLAEHNSRDRIYPASLTKIMTALLAIENSNDLEETIVLPDRIFPRLYFEGASMAGFAPGEEASIRDLLFGILLPSGAECCLAAADCSAGSESAFVALMNRKAEEIGMTDTHFCNCTGLHDPDHYSSVRDISLLLRYALTDPAFRKAFCSRRYTTRPTTLHPDGLTLSSTLFQYLDSPDVIGGAILGGKTGFTREAGLCLASLSMVNGREYILVTAKAPGTHDTEQYHILDAVDVYGQIGRNSQ